MAEAVQALFPGTQVTIGPVIENGWFYDFAKAEPFVPEDLPRIEKKMHEIIARNAAFTKEVWSRDKAKAHFRDKGEHFKVELVDAIPAGEDLKIYSQGEWLDLCRGPHMTSTGAIGKGFKLQRFSGQLLARQRGRPAAAAHLRHGLGHRGGAARPISISSRRRKSATTASSAARWTCSISRTTRRAPCSGTPRAGRCSRN